MQQKIHDGAVITEKSTLTYDHWIKLTKFSLEQVIYKPLKNKKKHPFNGPLFKTNRMSQYQKDKTNICKP